MSTGTIIVYEITPLDTELRIKTGYWKVNMTAQHPIKSDYLLRMTFPSGLQVQQLAGCVVVAESGTVINPANSCNADGAFNQIVLTNFVTSELAAGTNIAFTVNGFINPGDYIPFLG